MKSTPISFLLFPIFVHFLSLSFSFLHLHTIATTPASAWAPTWRPRAAAAAAAVAWLRWPAPGRAASAESCGSRGTSPGNEQETFSGKDRMTVPQSVESLRFSRTLLKHRCGSSFGPENKETSIGNSTQKPRRFTQLQLPSAAFDTLKDLCPCLVRLLGVSSTASGANPSAELECGSLWRLPWRSVATRLLLLPKTCTNSDDRRFCWRCFHQYTSSDVGAVTNMFALSRGWLQTSKTH